LLRFENAFVSFHLKNMAHLDREESPMNPNKATKLMMI
jgi:hypothetical protein